MRSHCAADMQNRSMMMSAKGAKHGALSGISFPCGGPEHALADRCFSHENSKTAPFSAGNTSLAAFLVTRPPYGYIGCALPAASLHGPLSQVCERNSY
jgi:hypothetical protein